MFRKLLTISALGLGLGTAQAQSVYTPVNEEYSYLISRYEIKSGKFAPSLHTTAKPFLRKSIAAFVDSLQGDSGLNPSKVDEFNLRYLANDNWEWAQKSDNDSKTSFPVIPTIYEKKSDFLQVNESDFNFHANPVLYFGMGKEQNADGNLFINSRGVEMRGHIGQKIGYYTFLTDNQITFPTYVRERMDSAYVVYNEGFWKYFKTNGRDFFTARGYVTFNPVKPVNVQFGHDKNFVGDGYRSLILSDFSSNYLFLKLNTKVWRFQYTNLFTQMTAEVQSPNNVFPKKFMTFHHLSFNVTKSFNIGVYEAVIFGRSDSLSNGSFDFNYLNPIIFYRAVEQQIGSKDNSIVGANFKWNFKRHFQLYGQLVLDEFVLGEIKARNGWWANKQAFQLGAKYIDVAGIKNLDMQGEINVVRPYTYAHFQEPQYTNYSNYGQALAHPLGANFYEMVGIVRYQPIERLFLVAKAIKAKIGEDSSGVNYGGNILLDYRSRVSEYGNTLAQGVQADLLFIDFTATYQLKHNLFIDLKQVVRKFDSQLDARDRNTFATTLAIRWNIPQRLSEF